MNKTIKGYFRIKEGLLGWNTTGRRKKSTVWGKCPQSTNPPLSPYSEQQKIKTQLIFLIKMSLEPVRWTRADNTEKWF